MGKSEFSAFKTFVKSSRVHNRVKLNALTEYILSNLLHNKPEELSIKKIIEDRALKFNFRNDIYEYLELFSDLLNDFIFFRRFKNNDISKNLFLLNQHTSLGNYKMYSKIDKKLKKVLFDNEQEYQLNYYKYLYSNEILHKRFKERKKKNLKEGEQNVNSYVFNFQSLSKYYFCEVVSIFTKYIRDENNFNITDKSPEIENLKFIVENMFAKLLSASMADNLVKLYYYQYLCFKSPEKTSNYKRYKKFLKRSEDSLSHSELKSHYSYILNYCLLLDNEKRESEFHTKELLESFKIFILRKYYIDENTQNHLSPSVYRNVVILSERVKDIKYLEELINKYSNELDPKLRKDFINYTNVFYFNLKNDYRTSIKYSFKVPNSYTGFLIDTKRINIINYYQLKKFDSAEKEIHALRELIRRQKLMPANVRKRFFTFCKYSERLILKTNHYTSISYSRMKLMAEDWFPSKGWLVDKYSDLLERKAS